MKYEDKIPGIVNLEDLICQHKLITTQTEQTLDEQSMKYKCIYECNGYNNKCDYYIALDSKTSRGYRK